MLHAFLTHAPRGPLHVAAPAISAPHLPIPVGKRAPRPAVVPASTTAPSLAVLSAIMRSA